MCLVSIVLPVYNGERYLSKSIESILSQTYKNIELIIVNDCSTDNTITIIDSYARKDNRIKVINNLSNQKLPESLNIGFSKAQGDYFSWTSDDNLYKKNAIECMVNYLNHDLSIDLISCTFDLIDDNDKIIGSSESFFNNVRSVNQLLAFNNIGACFLYRSAISKKIGKYDKNLFLAEDYDYWMRIATEGNVKYVNKKLYLYRVHSGSLSSKNSNVMLVANKVVLKNLIPLSNRIGLNNFQINRIKSNVKLKLFRLQHIDGLKIIKNFNYNYFCNFFYFISFNFLYFKTKFLSDFYKETRNTLLSSEIPSNKKIAIYGFGPYGKEVFVYFFFKNRIVGIYDRDFESKGILVENPNKINSSKFDYIVVTVMNPDVRTSVTNFLKEKNVAIEQIVFVEYL